MKRTVAAAKDFFRVALYPAVGLLLVSSVHVHADEDVEKTKPDRFFLSVGLSHWVEYEVGLEELVRSSCTASMKATGELGAGIHVTDRLSVGTTFSQLPRAVYVLGGPTRETYLSGKVKGTTATLAAEYKLPLRRLDPARDWQLVVRGGVARTQLDNLGVIKWRESEEVVTALRKSQTDTDPFLALGVRIGNTWAEGEELELMYTRLTDGARAVEHAFTVKTTVRF